ncbi:MAG: glycerophosphodiester phosphodiesterase [Sphaerochaeta sp.]|uniref:glycerophosphodiester phosphodiesterase n=1 Tax=Sphaerochaeta sp. TaxID=1972642 RepID=UPI002FC642C0
MNVFAHRGYSGLYPENTMYAFEMAAKAGCKAIELDVHLSQDGKLVVIHDETLDRTTDAKGFVRDYSCKALQKVNAGNADMFQPIPSLDEYCNWAKRHGVTTNIEVKTNLYYYPGIEEKVLALLKKHDLVEQTIISSFNHGSVITMKRLEPSIRCAFLVGSRGLGNAGQYANLFGVEYFHPDGSTLTKAAVEECKAHGVGVNVWTVNDLGMLRSMMDWQVDGIITNYCEDVLTLLAKG